MSNHGNSNGGHYDARAGFGNTSTSRGSDDAWAWPSDLPDQRAPSPPRPAPAQASAPARAPAPSLPHFQFNRQLPPLSHSNPIASLTAALRAEDVGLPGYSSYSSRARAEAAATQRERAPPHRHPRGDGPGRTASIPDYLFYSPPDSPESPESPEQSPEPQPYQQTNGTSHQQSHLHTGSTSHQSPHLQANPPSQQRSNLQTNDNSPQSSHTPRRPNTAQPGPSTQPATPRIALSSANNSPAIMPRGATTSSTRKRSHSTAAIVVDDVDDSPKAKRARKASIVSIDEDEEEDDDDEALTAEQEMLEKERQELVNRQREESGRPVRINDLTCMICLERFTNMSVTHCGHIFCHECLTQALNASERASERHVGCCPACRKPIKRGLNSKNQIIPLSLMVKPMSKSKLVQEKKGSRRSSKTMIDVDVD